MKYVHSAATGDFTESTILYAQWASNNCSVAFDVNGGYELPETEKSRTTVYEQKIGELPNPTRRRDTRSLGGSL